MTGSNNPLVPGGALSDSYIDPASTALVAPEISAPVFDASQPSARYVSPKDMAGNALLNLAGRAASGFYEGVVKPVGQVFTGELTPSMEPGPGLLSVPEYAGNFALNALGARGLGFAAPQGSVGMFAGELALRQPGYLHKMNSLDEFERLEKQIGPWPNQTLDDRRRLFEQTGWMRGAAGDPQFIISEANAGLNFNNLYENVARTGDIKYAVPDLGNLQLNDILNHEDLFKAYPELRNVNVRPLDKLSEDLGSLGGYDPDSNTLYLASQTAPNMASTMYHEVQHVIQGIEHWPKGGRPRDFYPSDYDLKYEVANKVNDSIERIITKAGYKPDEVAGELGFYPNSNPNPISFGGRSLGLPQTVIDAYRGSTEALRDLSKIRIDAHKQYMNMAGEVQARVTQAQHHLSRWDQLPEDIGPLHMVRVNRFSNEVKPEMRPYPAAETQGIQYHYNPDTNMFHPATPVDYDPFDVTTPGGDK